MTSDVKCVVWDIDNTLLQGVYLESAEVPPPADPELTGVLHELAGRGILQALASRNPPEAAQYVRNVTGMGFAAVECGWGSKAESIERIAAELDIPPDSIAFVDDDMLERAEVAARLPDVLVLAAEDAAEMATWPQFSPATVTDEARRRGQLYAERRLRQEAAGAFGGSRDEFLRHVGTRMTIAPAQTSDAGRLHELSVRTHQLSSGSEPMTEADLAGLLQSPDHQVETLRLADDFGDDGLVGGAVLTWTTPASVTVPLIMMSCRALGRGALDALLAWTCHAAAHAGASELAVPCLVTDRNVPMRLALAAAGLRAESGTVAADGRTVFTRSLAGDLPELADWVIVEARR